MHMDNCPGALKPTCSLGFRVSGLGVEGLGVMEDGGMDSSNAIANITFLHSFLTISNPDHQ